MSYFEGRGRGISFLLVGVALASSNGVWAATTTENVIETITVTAEKRESSAQDTAIALAAFDNEDLQLRGITDITDLQWNTPNLVISPNSQSPVTYAYIRGVGSDQLVAGFDPGVAYHFDGIYVGQPSSMPGDLWDMERVEVLRGPQGTLYGRNTTGGSINVITNDPTDKFDALVDVTGGNYGDERVRGAVNLPLTDSISGRVSFIQEQNDGYQDNIFNNSHAGDVTDYYSVRGKLKFDFGDSANLVLTAQTFENDGNQSQRRREPFGPNPAFVGAIPNPSDAREVGKDFHEKLDLTNHLYSARLTWDIDLGAMGPATLVAVSGYIDNNWFQQADIDQSSNPLQFQKWAMDTDQFTQEIRLVSAGDGPWEWIGGLFYFDEHLSSNYVFQDALAFGGFDFANGGNLDTRSYAAFGEIGYDFRKGGHPFKVVGGMRYTLDEKDVYEYQIIPLFAVNAARDNSENWDQPTGNIEADYFVSDDVMTYIRYSHGYKGGGYSLGQFDNYNPEKMNAFEAGVKSQFWNNRAQVNVAAFYDKYEDLQVNFLNGTSFTTDNAAKATIKGVELETQFIVVDNLSAGANVSWLSAEFDKYPFSALPPPVDLSGETLNRAPKYTTQLFLQYDWVLGNYGTVTARAQYYWQDKVYYRVPNLSRNQADAFYTADARLMWTSNDARWVVDTFVQNLTDEDNLRNMTANDAAFLSSGALVSQDSFYPPRTYGVRVGYHIGGQ